MSYLGTLCLACIVVANVIVGFPLGKASPKPDSLLGLAPGNKLADVRRKLGDPLLVRSLPDGSHVSWNRAPAQDAYIMLGERDGLISYVRLISASVGPVEGVSDPFDVPLGGNQLGLRTLRGKPQSVTNVGSDQIRAYPGDDGQRWLYTIRADEVHAIMLTTADQLAAENPMPNTPGGAPTLPPSKMIDARDGTTSDRAFILHASDEDEGTRFEQFFVKTLPGCGQIWSIDQHARVLERKRHFEKMELACGETGTTRLVFFDITSFIGKVVPPTEIP